MTSLKFWDGFQWIEIGSVPGPQGIQGVQGIQGIQGPTGPTAVVAQPGTPSNTNVLWVDTDDPDTSPYTVEAVHVLGSAGEPAFAANWSNYSVPAFLPGGFYKDSQSRVFLQGLVKKAIAVATPDTIFTLPAGYRPGSPVLLCAISNSALARVDIQTTGAVQVMIGNAGWVALDGLSFRATQ